MLRHTLITNSRALQPAAFLAVLGAFLGWYIWEYLHYPARPGNDPMYPLGWWGWFDQSQYLTSEKAFLNLDFSPVAHYYPPLYSLLAAFAHSFVVVNAFSFLLYLTVILWIGTRIYGMLLSYWVIVATFVLFRPITLLLWVIPWSTSLSAGLVAILFGLLFHLWKKPAPWVLATRADWFAVSTFYLTYGALFAVRPLDVFVLFPAAFVLFWNTISHISSTPKTPKLPRLVRAILVIGIFGFLFPGAYLLFNLYVFGNPIGGYFSINRLNGYVPDIFLFKLVAIIFDSETVYLERGQALVNQYWAAYFAFPILLVSLFRAPGIIRIITLTILLQYAIYLPYGDLQPTSLFQFLNVHYFKWTLPWMTLISVGESVAWISELRQSLVARVQTSMAILLILIATNLKFAVYNFETVSDKRDGARRRLDIELGTQRAFDVLDMASHVPRSFEQTYFAPQNVQVDGHRLRRMSDFVLLPAPWGMRLIFQQTQRGSHIRIVFDPTLSALETGSGTSRLGSYRFSLLCRVSSCNTQLFDVQVSPKVLPLDSGAIQDRMRIGFGSAGNAESLLQQGWSGPEQWGRWTSNTVAKMLIPPLGHPVRAVDIELYGLVTNIASVHKVSLFVNTCRVIDTELRFPDDSGVVSLTGVVPDTCTEPDKPIQISFETDRTRRPVDIMMGSSDTRELGLGVISLTLHEDGP